MKNTTSPTIPENSKVSSKKVQDKTVQIKRTAHVLDATGVSVGRLATQIAVLLMGKHKTDWRKHKDVGDIVHVKNVREVKLTGKKRTSKVYIRYSGYPGGIKDPKASELFVKQPQKLVIYAVYNMLPKNFQRDRLMKRLHFDS